MHNLYLVQVKSPEKMKGKWDYYDVKETIPGDETLSVARNIPMQTCWKMLCAFLDHCVATTPWFYSSVSGTRLSKTGILQWLARECGPIWEGDGSISVSVETQRV